MDLDELYLFNLAADSWEAAGAPPQKNAPR